MSEDRSILLSSLSPSRREEQAAFAVMLFLLALFLGVLPFEHVRLGQLNAFLPIAATIMFLNDSITATLLYAHFAVQRSRALLVLANGYLFTALVIVPYALTFPGAFAPTGLLGAGLQTPGWLFQVWHLGLPAAIVAYALLQRAPAGMQLVRGSVPVAILASITGVIVLVCCVTWVVTVHEDMLPVIVVTVTDPGGVVKIVSAIILILAAAALVLLWFSRRSKLDLWLLVVSFAWVLSALLVNLVDYRFDVAWYANRIFSVMSASFVLFVLLAEMTMLYARLALSALAQRQEREARLWTMDAMSAAIAHEISQPLAGITTHTSAGLRWLARTPPDLKMVHKSLNGAASGARRASEVLASVRTLFRKDREEKLPLDINELVLETVALVRDELQAAGIVVKLELATRLPPVTAHRGQLQEVLLNLIRNAADAMRAVSGRVARLQVTSTLAEANCILLGVKDSGAGIDPKNTDRIFEPFFTTKTSGMGMGLAICRSIVETHGGRLWAAPAKPHGTVFQLQLPISA